ncbi:MAG: hypothetical protein ABJ275_04865 [Maricaulaceae bacterium]
MTITHHIKRPLDLRRPQGKSLPRNWVFLGLGYSAKALITQLPDGLNLVGTSRNPSNWTDDLRAKVQGLTFTGVVSKELKAALKQADVILVSLPPSEAGDPFLAGLKEDMQALAPQAKWVGYLSATSVYGDRAGQWTFEDELLRPTTARGKNRVEAELAWLETGLPVHIFRLAGIYGGTYYGQSRNPFGRIESGKANAIIKHAHVVNRIHVEDIASAIIKSIHKPDPTQVYNLADGRPAPPQEVLRFAARLLGTIVPVASLDETKISDMVRSFYSETKRISIDKARTALGWHPAYDNYNVGLMHIYKDKYLPDDAVILTGYLDIPKHIRYTSDGHFRELLREHIDVSRAEPGCVFFKISNGFVKRRRLHIVEIFETPDSYHVHQARTHLSEWYRTTRLIERHYNVIGLAEQ